MFETIQLYHMIKNNLIKQSCTIISFKCLFTISIVLAANKHLGIQQSGYIKCNVSVVHYGNSLLSFDTETKVEYHNTTPR